MIIQMVTWSHYTASLGQENAPYQNYTTTFLRSTKRFSSPTTLQNEPYISNRLTAQTSLLWLAPASQSLDSLAWPDKTHTPEAPKLESLWHGSTSDFLPAQNTYTTNEDYLTSVGFFELSHHHATTQPAASHLSDAQLPLWTSTTELDEFSFILEPLITISGSKRISDMLQSQSVIPQSNTQSATPQSTTSQSATPQSTASQFTASQITTHRSITTQDVMPQSATSTTVAPPTVTPLDTTPEIATLSNALMTPLTTNQQGFNLLNGVKHLNQTVLTLATNSKTLISSVGVLDHQVAATISSSTYIQSTNQETTFLTSPSAFSRAVISKLSLSFASPSAPLVSDTQTTAMSTENPLILMHSTWVTVSISVVATQGGKSSPSGSTLNGLMADETSPVKPKNVGISAGAVSGAIIIILGVFVVFYRLKRKQHRNARPVISNPITIKHM